MQSWAHDSIFAEWLAEEDLVATSFRAHRRQSSVDSRERNTILQRAAHALQRAQVALAGQDTELHWIGQLLTYVQRLQGIGPARTPDEQFSQIYYLRKWIFWVPVALLQRAQGQGPAMLTLAQFYATALALEPLFPDLGSSFCGAVALPPLEKIIGVTNSMQSVQQMSPASMEIASVMQYPQEVAQQYRNRAAHTQHVSYTQESSYTGISPVTMGPASMANLSPAFAPPSLHYSNSQSSSATQSPFLEVPSGQAGFSYGTQGWGVVPSPSLPPQTYHAQDEQQIYGYLSSNDFGAGFVSPPIWT